MPAVKPIPDGYSAITPYLIVEGAAKAISLYTKVFGAMERMRLPSPDGRVAHAELNIGGSMLMLADPFPEIDAHPPGKYGGSPVSLMLYVPDVDTVVARAVANGCTLLKPVQDQFYGDRTGTVRDPFGHVWTIGTHVEEVPQDELERRMAAMMQPAETGAAGAGD